MVKDLEHTHPISQFPQPAADPVSFRPHNCYQGQTQSLHEVQENISNIIPI